MRKKLNEWADASKILHGFVILGFALAVMVSILSCQDIRIGKSREDLSMEMFRVDSLIKTIHMQMDSVAMDFNKLYIDAQKINNGH
tara:strand:+ start:8333 stop:8590 length:258 start_codon:yes stop_codon:yes gene_type:complete